MYLDDNETVYRWKSDLKISHAFIVSNLFWRHREFGAVYFEEGGIVLLPYICIIESGQQWFR